MTFEEKLWTDFIAGNEMAFQKIYKSYIQLLFKYGCHFSNDEEFIKDCIQDLFLDLLRYRSKLNKPESIKAYLLTSLKRKIIKKNKLTKKIQIINIERLPFDFSLVSSETDELSIMDQRLKMLSKAIDGLPPKQKEAIYLKYVVGLNYEELSNTLNLNYQVCRNLIYKSMENLKKCISKGSMVLLTLFYPLIKFN